MIKTKKTSGHINVCTHPYHEAQTLYNECKDNLPLISNSNPDKSFIDSRNALSDSDLHKNLNLPPGFTVCNWKITVSNHMKSLQRVNNLPVCSLICIYRDYCIPIPKAHEYKLHELAIKVSNKLIYTPHRDGYSHIDMSFDQEYMRGMQCRFTKLRKQTIDILKSNGATMGMLGDLCIGERGNLHLHGLIEGFLTKSDEMYEETGLRYTKHDNFRNGKDIRQTVNYILGIGNSDDVHILCDMHQKIVYFGKLKKATIL